MFSQDLVTIIGFMCLVSLVQLTNAQVSDSPVLNKLASTNRRLPTNWIKKSLAEELNLGDFRADTSNFSDEKLQSLRRLRLLAKLMPALSEKGGEDLTVEKVNNILRLIDENLNKPNNRLQQLLNQRLAKKPVRHPFIGK